MSATNWDQGMDQPRVTASGPAQGGAPAWLAVVRRGVEALLLIVLAVLLARAIWFGVYGTDALLLPIEPARSEMTSGSSRADSTDASGLFRSLAPQQQVQTAPESRLGFVLKGVRVGQTPQSGSAIIEIPQQGQARVAVGEALAPGVTLDQVHADRVILLRQGVAESLFLTDAARQRALDGAPSAPVRAAEPAASAATPENVQEAERDMAYGWLADLSLTPARSSAGEPGLRVTGDAEALSRLGLQSGDLILSLNGASLTSQDAAIRAFAALEAADRAVARVERDGEDILVETSLR